MVDPSRFQPIEDLREWFPDVDFSGNNTFAVNDRGLIITDPTYLVDVYNPNDDGAAAYVRAHAVIVCDFGGDDSCPVWWHDPYLILPLSTSIPEEFIPPNGIVELVDEVGCDSGS